MGTLGVQEMIVVFIVALVLFGPKKLPELGRTIGKALTEFRRASSDLKATFEREMQTLERESQSLKQITDHTANQFYDDVTGSDPFWTPPPEDAAGQHPASDHPSSDHPSTVGVPEVANAESHGAAETADLSLPENAPGVEGTVPRNGTGHLEAVGQPEAAQAEAAAQSEAVLQPVVAASETHGQPETHQS